MSGSYNCGLGLLGQKLRDNTLIIGQFDRLKPAVALLLFFRIVFELNS